VVCLLGGFRRLLCSSHLDKGKAELSSEFDQDADADQEHRVAPRLHRPVRPFQYRTMISSDKAQDFEKRLSMLLECRPDELRDWLGQRIDYGPRRTGLRWVRGSHGGGFVADPEGTDELPPGYEPPPGWRPPGGYRLARHG
jgi:hypothetical protein